jgi:adenosylmethionine-8-amino-7-oxononanoate aminotransferase
VRPSAAQLDHAHVWHPFTQMRDWLRHEPLVITSGRGAVLRDARGRSYLDANSSIWTNLHGHRHPRLDAALKRQLEKIAHCSALGLANEPAARLAADLVHAANPQSEFRPPHLGRVFFSDDGSTALEAALKLAYEFARRTRGPRPEPRFLALEGGYHGDTVGAMSVGYSGLFHGGFRGLLFQADRVMAPYCYRCPFNRARPERADAREYRRCGWECVGQVERRLARRAKRGAPHAGFVVEPGMQGAAGMIPQPAGWLARVAELARGRGTPLIADEVMTGFGRAVPSCSSSSSCSSSPLFASHAAGVQPDFLCLAKGLTGGYLPMAATLTTPTVFDAFLGEYAEFKTFFHGHSYTANPLGAAVARESLRLLHTRASLAARRRLEAALREELRSLWALPHIGDVRQVGLTAGVELVRDWRTREPYDLRERAGLRVGEAMARRGVLTRPIGSVIVVMPPYCTTPAQVRRIVAALADAVAEVLGGVSVGRGRSRAPSPGRNRP